MSKNLEFKFLVPPGACKLSKSSDLKLFVVTIIGTMMFIASVKPN